VSKEGTYRYESSYKGEPIRADDILPCEQETVISFEGDVELATIYSAKPAIIRGLLRHPDFTIEELTLRERRGGEAVVAILGHLPIGAIKIGKKRKSNRQSQVVSYHPRK